MNSKKTRAAAGDTSHIRLEKWPIKASTISQPKSYKAWRLGLVANVQWLQALLENINRRLICDEHSKRSIR
jgi:hypothetical protein